MIDRKIRLERIVWRLASSVDYFKTGLNEGVALRQGLASRTDAINTVLHRNRGRLLKIASEFGSIVVLVTIVVATGLEFYKIA